jgi:hypothetical protein
VSAVIFLTTIVAAASARVVATVVKRYNKMRAQKLGETISKLKSEGQEGTTEMNDLVERQAKLETGHVLTSSVRNFIANNKDLVELNLSGCSFLGEVPEGLSNLKNLKSVNFHGCENMTGTIELPASVTRLPEDAFRGCSKLGGIKCLAPTIEDIGDNAFCGCKKLLPPDLAELTGHDEETHNQYDFVELLISIGTKISDKWRVNERFRNRAQGWVRDAEKALKLFGPIRNWNTTGVTDMNGAFKGASDFNEVLGEWNVRDVVDMEVRLEGEGEGEGEGGGVGLLFEILTQF